MSFETTVEFVATASGFDGLCREYVYDTVKGLQACGIRDYQLEKLVVAVQQRLASREYFRYRLMALCYAAVAEW